MKRSEAIAYLAETNTPQQLWEMVGITLRLRRSPVVRRAYRNMLTNYLGALELQGHRAAHGSEVVQRMMGGMDGGANE